VSLLLLEGDLLVGLAVGDVVTCLWKIVKRHGLLLDRCCEVVFELLISGVEEKLAIRKKVVVLCEFRLEKKVSLHGVRKIFMVARISPTWRTSYERTRYS
jgi:hypothetical protein